MREEQSEPGGCKDTGADHTEPFHANEPVFSKSLRRNLLESITWEMT